MMQKIVLCALAALAACTAGTPGLEAGTWTGHLTPMNHPEMQTPLTYEVAHGASGPTLAIGGPEGGAIPAHGVALTADTLSFVFDEPEEGVTLTCALAPHSDGRYEGRCTAPDGKWARFTMIPPAR